MAGTVILESGAVSNLGSAAGLETHVSLCSAAAPSVQWEERTGAFSRECRSLISKGGFHSPLLSFPPICLPASCLVESSLFLECSDFSVSPLCEIKS